MKVSWAHYRPASEACDAAADIEAHRRDDQAARGSFHVCGQAEKGLISFLIISLTDTLNP
jgi:hypothetical protein